MTDMMTQINSSTPIPYVIKETEENFLPIIIGSLIVHLIYGTTVGVISSLLSIRFGTRYRCSLCDISFIE